MSRGHRSLSQRCEHSDRGSARPAVTTLSPTTPSSRGGASSPSPYPLPSWLGFIVLGSRGLTPRGSPSIELALSSGAGYTGSLRRRFPSWCERTHPGPPRTGIPRWTPESTTPYLQTDGVDHHGSCSHAAPSPRRRQSCLPSAPLPPRSRPPRSVLPAGDRARAPILRLTKSLAIFFQFKFWV